MKLINKVLKFIVNLFSNMEDEKQKVIELAINVVNAVKMVLDGEVDDVAIAVISLLNPALGTTLNTNKDKLEKMLPDLILKLTLMKDIPGETQNDKVKYVLELLRVSDEDTQNAAYHNLCALVTKALSDGKITWTESILINEAKYKNLI